MIEKWCPYVPDLSWLCNKVHCQWTGTAIAWEILLVFDTMIISLTLYKAFQGRIRGMRILDSGQLMKAIVRDGEWVLGSSKMPRRLTSLP